MRHLVEEIKNRLTSEDVDKLIYSLGGSKGADTDEYNIYSTVCHNHNGNGSYKLYYYKSSKTFYCYTNCQNLDVVGLVEHALDLEFKQAVSYLSKLLDIQNTLAPVGFGNVFYNKPVEEHIEEDIDVVLPVVDDNILNLFMDYHCSEWLYEGISHETMSKYNIRYFLDQHKIIIPHYNIDGGLVGIRGRALLKEDLDKGQKYMPVYIGNKGYAHSLMHNLYGLNFTKQIIKNAKKVIVFEGEKSVLLMDSFYGESNCSVAVCGSKIHKAHAKMLLELGVEEVIIAFDKQYRNIDEKNLWRKKIYKSLKHLLPFCRVSIIWDDIDNGLLGYKDSPTDMGKEVFEKLLKAREEVIDLDLSEGL